MAGRGITSRVLAVAFGSMTIVLDISIELALRNVFYAMGPSSAQGVPKSVQKMK
jgi:hypothetical protein